MACRARSNSNFFSLRTAFAESISRMASAKPMSTAGEEVSSMGVLRSILERKRNALHLRHCDEALDLVVSSLCLIDETVNLVKRLARYNHSYT